MVIATMVQIIPTMVAFLTMVDCHQPWLTVVMTLVQIILTMVALITMVDCGIDNGSTMLSSLHHGYYKLIMVIKNQPWSEF